MNDADRSMREPSPGTSHIAWRIRPGAVLKRKAYFILEDIVVDVLGGALAGDQRRGLLGGRGLPFIVTELVLQQRDGAAEAGDRGSVQVFGLFMLFMLLVLVLLVAALTGREPCLGNLGGGALLDGRENGVAVLLVAGEGAGEGGVHARHVCVVGDFGRKDEVTDLV